uniref:Uncharacterized protein n=1 Tax=Octopus bimaculoides TaxID=37653 RepID=A0A0L8GCG3_OCTBM
MWTQARDLAPVVKVNIHVSAISAFVKIRLSLFKHFPIYIVINGSFLQRPHMLSQRCNIASLLNINAGFLVVKSVSERFFCSADIYLHV